MPVENGRIVTEWQRWFAWRPVRLTGGGLVWLQPVQRRTRLVYDSDVNRVRRVREYKRWA